MSQISQIDYETAPQDVREAHDEELRLRGRMTNMKRVLLHSPKAHGIYAEWFTLYDLLTPIIPSRALWIFSMAISSAANSRTAVTFFRRALTGAGLNPDALDLSGEEDVLVQFGQAIVGDSTAVPQALWDALKARYDKPTLVNLVAFAGIMLATAVFINTVGIEMDGELAPFA